MLASATLPGSLKFSSALPRSRRLPHGTWRQVPVSQSRSPSLYNKTFSLRVRLEETGDIFVLLSCHGDTTVRELKEELDLMAGIPFHFQRLLYLDQGILMDDSTLGYHDVVPGGILSMCIWHHDGWQELALAALEGDASKLSCLGVTEDSLYRTPHSMRLRADKHKEWIAERAFVALYIATHRGHLEAVRFLLENGANCLGKTPIGRTALHVAAAMGHVNCINLLLDYGAPVTERDLKGETPVEVARRLKRKEATQAFIKNYKKFRRVHQSTISYGLESVLAYLEDTSKNRGRVWSPSLVCPCVVMPGIVDVYQEANLEIFLTEEENSINLLENGQYYNALWNLHSIIETSTRGHCGITQYSDKLVFISAFLKCYKSCSLYDILNFRRSSCVKGLILKGEYAFSGFTNS